MPMTMTMTMTIIMIMIIRLFTSTLDKSQVVATSMRSVWTNQANDHDHHHHRHHYYRATNLDTNASTKPHNSIRSKSSMKSTGKPHNPMLNAGAIMSCSLMLQVHPYYHDSLIMIMMTINVCQCPKKQQLLPQMVEPHGSLADKYDFLLQYIQVKNVSSIINQAILS